jgi:hypothetical protein
MTNQEDVSGSGLTQFARQLGIFLVSYVINTLNHNWNILYMER